jgi:hypothetical protein
MISQPEAPTAEEMWGSMAWRIRFLYWSRKDLTPGFGDDALWFNLAQELSARVIALDLFIEAQFYGRQGYTPLPSPRGLLHRSAFQRYEEYRQKQGQTIVKELRLKLDCQQSYMETEVALNIKRSGGSEEDGIRHALAWESSQFSPLFCCLLTSEKGGRLASRASHYFFEAVLQYVPMQLEYDKAWGTYISPDFRSESVEAYIKLFSPNGDD